jgi:GAF domain-containing protein
MLAAATRALANAPLDERALLELVAGTVGDLVSAGCVVHLSQDGSRPAVTVSDQPTDGSDDPLADRIRGLLASADSIVALSVAPRVNESAERLVIPRVDSEDDGAAATLEAIAACEALGIESLLLVPLRTQGKSMGLLLVFRDASVPHFDARDCELARTLADHAASPSAPAVSLRQSKQSEPRADRARKPSLARSSTFGTPIDSQPWARWSRAWRTRWALHFTSSRATPS